MGIRRSDDVFDNEIQASVINETSTEEEITSQEFPKDESFSTVGNAGERLVIAAKNITAGPSPDKTAFAEVAILLENA